MVIPPNPARTMGSSVANSVANFYGQFEFCLESFFWEESDSKYKVSLGRYHIFVCLAYKDYCETNTFLWRYLIPHLDLSYEKSNAHETDAKLVTLVNNLELRNSVLP